jgi:membrane protein DedA with SNARE-associated domain
VTPQKLRLGQYLFMRWGGWVVFVGRFIAILRIFAAVLAGANRLEPKRFFLFNAAGGLLWAHVFGLGGYFLTTAFTRIQGPIAFAAFVLVALGLVHLSQYLKANEERLLAEAEAAIAVKSSEPAS